MSTDRELLELAAKAYWAGEIDDVMSFYWDEQESAISYTHADNQDHNGNDVELLWNPLIDDGDALRLAVKLGISLAFLYSQLMGGFKRGVSARLMDIEVEEWGDDIEDVTRIAIVRAAAEIGKGMQ